MIKVLLLLCGADNAESFQLWKIKDARAEGNISPYYHLLLDWGVQYGSITWKKSWDAMILIQDIELPWEIEAPGNMMLSPGFSIIHKADNPRGLPHLHFTEVEKVSGSGNALARENTLFCWLCHFPVSRHFPHSVTQHAIFDFYSVYFSIKNPMD